jgi:signal transduction histidine kinase
MQVPDAGDCALATRGGRHRNAARVRRTTVPGSPGSWTDAGQQLEHRAVTVSPPSSSPPVRPLLLAGLVMACVLALAAAVAPRSGGPEVRAVPLAAMQLLPANLAGLPRTPGPGEVPLAPQTIGRGSTAAVIGQLHWSLAVPPTGEVGVFAPASGRSLQLFVNGVPVAVATRQPLAGPWQGSHSLVARVPPLLVSPGEANRADLILGKAEWGRIVPQVLVGPVPAVTEAAQDWEVWLGRARLVTGLAAVVGLVTVLAGLMLGRHLAGFAAGLAVSAALAWQVWATTTTGQGAQVGTAVPLAGATAWFGPVLLGAAALAMLSARTLTGPGRGILGGLAAAAALAALVGTAGDLGLVWPRLGAGQLGIEVSLGLLGPVLLVGVGMPLLLLDSARALVTERRAARQLAEQQRALVAEQALRLRQEEEARLVLEERQRFTRDIHDGIGGQLTSLLWRVRMGRVDPDEVAGEIERGIADIRLVADALSESSDSLSEALENFAARARQQLDAAGIGFEWEMPEGLDVRWDDQRRILSLYRILQEAVTNAVRHSQASLVTIRFEGLAGGVLRVVIADDGVGISAEARAGRGLANMRARAIQLGGTLLVGDPPSGAGGTRIAVELPPAGQPASATPGAPSLSARG